MIPIRTAPRDFDMAGQGDVFRVGQFQRRYQRFFADVLLPDAAGNVGIVPAHCANTGSMLGLLDPTFGAWLSPQTNPQRKLPYTLEAIITPMSPVGVNTGRTNRLVQVALAQQKIAQLAGYPVIKPEQKYATDSRIDFLLSAPGRPACYVEVKNVTYAQGQTALFPDAVTARGVKHLQALMGVVAAGQRAVMLYVVQRMDCTQFQVAAAIDPAYAVAWHAAVAAGVEMYAYQCCLTLGGIELTTEIPIVNSCAQP